MPSNNFAGVETVAVYADLLVERRGFKLMAIAGWRPFKTRDAQESNGRDVLRIDPPMG